MKKTLKKKILAGLLTLSLLAGVVGSNVKAAPLPPQPPKIGPELKIKKILNLSENGVTTPAETFTFVFEKHSKDGDELKKDELPEIGEKTIDYTVADVTDSDSATTGKQILKESDDILQGIFFPSVGQFTYTVTEKEGTTKDMTYSKEKYTVSIFTERHQDGHIVVKSIHIAKTANKTGEVIDIKKSPDTDFSFTNDYNKLGSFDLTKKVDDNVDNKISEHNLYPFTFTVTKPENSTATTFKYKKDGDQVDTEGTYGTAITVDLKHEQKVEFTEVLLGSTVSAEETDSLGYTPSIGQDSKLNGEAVTIEKLASGMIIGDAGKAVFDKADNHVLFVNTQQTPTGVLIDNLPFIALALAAGIGIFFFVKNGRRNEEFEV